MEYLDNAYLSFVSKNHPNYQKYIIRTNFTDAGYSDNGEECKNRCGKTDGVFTETYDWCWTVNVSIQWDYCTPQDTGIIQNPIFSLNFPSP